MRILISLYEDPHIILIKAETIHLYHKIGQLSAVVVDHPKQSVPGDQYGDTCVNLTMTMTTTTIATMMMMTIMVMIIPNKKT